LTLFILGRTIVATFQTNIKTTTEE